MKAVLWCLVAVLAAACDSGGELADETLRRSAEQALDTSTVPPPAQVDTGYRLPAFADVPVVDSVAQGDTTPAPQPSRWTQGVTERRVQVPGTVTVRDVRVGRNAGFDRLVIGMGSDPLPPYRIEYAVKPVRACGSGEVVPLEGDAALLVRLHQTQAHDEQGRVTVARPEIRADMPVIRQVKIICDFEAEVVVAIGTTAARPYRVLTEQDPTRLIVDLEQP